MAPRVRGLLAAALLATTLAACGEEGAARFGASQDLRPGGGGALEVAVPPPGGYLDPLRAATPAARLVTRQVFEPLVSEQHPPYEGDAPQRGLALDWSHSRDYRVWSFVLRPRVDFQDGEPFNAAAVSANATRWIGDPNAAALLPGLVTVDAPRPTQVRFIFSVPVRDVPRRLADPRLGIVSPLALNGGEAGAVGSPNAGTGAFRPPRRQDGDAIGAGRLSLLRNARWWGGRVGLGPALDELVFRVVPSPARRVRLLRRGEVEAAVGLAPRVADALRDEPLLTTIRGPGGVIGYERSVHGLRPGDAQPLTGVWTAVVGGGA